MRPTTSRGSESCDAPLARALFSQRGCRLDVYGVFGGVEERYRKLGERPCNQYTGDFAVACRSNRGSVQHSAEALARYMAYAGPPIPYFTWLGHFWSFEALGKDTLVVFTVPDEAYLLKVWPPCDLRFVINAIGITSTASTIYARTDSITVNSAGTGPGRWRCPIEEIRKIDYKGMRADQRAQAQQAKAGPRSDSATPAAPAAPPPGEGKQ